MSRFLNNLSVRSKVVLLISAVVFVLLTSVLALVWGESRSQVRTIIGRDLDSNIDAFHNIERYRIRDRAHVALFLGSKMARFLDPVDEKQACDSLQRALNYTGTDPNDSAHIDYAALQTSDSKVIAIAMRGKPGCDVQIKQRDLPLVSAALDNLLLTNWESPERNVYSIYAAKITGPDSQPLGIVSIGYRVDQDSAKLAAQRASGTNGVVFWHPEKTGSGRSEIHIIAASDNKFGAALKENLPTGHDDVTSRTAYPFRAEGGLYLLKEVTPDAPGVTYQNAKDIHIGLVESVTDRLRPFVVLSHYLVILAVCSLLIGVVLGAILSGPLVKPLIGLANIARDVKKGKYEGIHQLKVDHHHVFQSDDEIGILCRAFEEMVTTLKQGRAMSKFISHTAYDSLQRSGTSNAAIERKWMVILFSDIREFTKFSEGRDPETVVHRLNEVLGIQAEIVSRHGGDIDKFIGDAVVAWFSGPDRCRHAIEAAREMFTELRARIGDRSGGQIGVGLHVGEVIVGALGSGDRLDYTAIGSTVNLAARLCSAAKDGQLLVSPAVVTELGGSVPVRLLPPINLKGFADPVPVYEVLFEGSPAAGGSEVTQEIADVTTT